MIHRQPQRRSGGATWRARAGAVLATLLAVILLSACGGSSKPGYCSAVKNLQTSIKALPNTDVVANGTSALKSALSKVQSDAKSVVDAAKSDFPTETTQLSSSVDALTSTVKSLPESPSVGTVAQIGGQVASVVAAGKAFATATSSKCG